MQQPNTNSEAVKRCLTIADAPRSSTITYAPKPPYAANHVKRDRPYSAPARRITNGNYSDPWRGPQFQEARIPVPRHYHVSLNHRSSETEFSRKAPYASRKVQAFFDSTLGYPRPDNGKSIPLPPYDPLNDPHLTDYFYRRFGAIQQASKRKNLSRPSSASSVLQRKKKKVDTDDSVLYKVAVITGDKKNAGTDAKAYITIKGLKGKIPKHRLTKKAGSVKYNKDVAFRFAKGSTHIFKIRGPELGDIKSVIVEHNGTKMEDAWYLQEVEITHVKKKKSWVFVCNQWLSLHHGDRRSHRELYPQISSKTDYEIVTVTGDLLNAGTNANVFLTIYGKTGATEKIHLKNYTKTLFDRGSSDVFRIHTNCVGPMRRVRIEHDNQGIGAGWFLERIVVTDIKNPKWKYYFPCGQWLARDEGDGAISRMLEGSRDPFAVRKESKYKITVYTGDVKGAGTDANVYMTLFGENGDSGEKKLASKRNDFERGKKDEFILHCPCLGRLERLRIGHDNSGFGPGWFLEKVIVDDTDNNIVYEFPCNRWFAVDEDDGQISRDLIVNVGVTSVAPGFPYIISVTTADESRAGTDARVFVILHGKKDKKDSGKIWLDTGEFKRNRTDIFNVDIAEMLSPLTKIEVGHDDSGAAPGWLCEQVIVYSPFTGLEQFFPCRKWLATDEGDGLIQRTLYEQKDMRKQKEKKITWFVLVKTSDVKNAGTDANVRIVLYGDKGKTDDMELDNKGDNFEQGQIDTFKISTSDVGKPFKLRVWHDNAGRFAGWHLDKIEMENMATKDKYVFKCGRWLAKDEDDGELVREIPAEGPGISKPLPVVHYTVEVHTGKKSGAGTDADVFIDIVGDLGDTGHRWLTKSKTNRNKFEKGNTDIFDIEAVTLMKLSKVVVGHNGKGPGAGWYLDKIVVKQEGEAKYDTEFMCNRWLAEDEDDGNIVRELTPSGSHMLGTTTYNVYVKTGDVRGSGTDANVFFKMFGSKGDSNSLELRNSETKGSNKFERGRTDLFKIDTKDIGKIKKIKIGHDNSKPGAGWFLDEVRIEVPSKGNVYLFAVHRWLAKDEGDGETEIELEPSHIEDREISEGICIPENEDESETSWDVSYDIHDVDDEGIPYEVTIWTGDKQNAGTNAKVFLQMYGEKGKKTEECLLRNKTDNFERGEIDKFKIEAADVGRLHKIRIGHNGKGMFDGWFLDKVLIQRRPRAGTKKFKGKKRESVAERRKSILAEYQDKDDSDGSSSSRSTSPTPRRRSGSRKRKKPELKTVEEEDEDVYDGDETEDYWFFVDRWFATSEDDGALVRELVPTDDKGRPLKWVLDEVEYKVKVVTGSKSGAGTDANVFVNMYGENSDSGERQLKESQNFNKFETAQEDDFIVKAIDLGKLVKLRVRHDNAGIGAAWFLDRIEVEDTNRKKMYYFLCQRWLATGEDDGQICRELVPVDKSVISKMGKDAKGGRKEVALETKAAMTTYHCKVKTGTKWGAGTDANVYVILFGEDDHTDKMFLKSSLNHKNKFESGQTDDFILEAVKIGALRKIKIGHDNKGGGAAWFLDKVTIDSPSLGKSWTFPCGKWLSKNDDDGLIERELFPQELATEEYERCIPYEVKVYTADKSGAGTSADVYVQLYGKEAATQQKMLCGSKKEREDRFKKGTMDQIIVELEDVGEIIEKIRIGHNNAGFGPGWYLDKVEIRKLHETGKGSVTYVFPCDRWLARDEDDHAIERELVAQKVVQETVTKDGQIRKKELKMRDQLKNKKYVVTVKTGDISGAGTDANVFLTMFGEKGDSGERKLHTSETHKDKFERNQSDIFNLEAVDLGSVYKIKIRHDNSLISPAWFLDYVEVKDTSDNQTFMFHCERWLAKNKDDRKIERSIYVKGYEGEMGSSTGTLRSTKWGSVASIDSMKSVDPFSKSPRLSRKQLEMEDIPEGETISYTVKVVTGQGEDNGTKSNVWVRLIGPKKLHTGRLFLELAQRDEFRPGSVETFSLDAVDIKEVKKLEIGHDGTSPGSGWFVKEVKVDIPTKGKHYTFACNRWLARDKGDGKTVCVFSVDDGISSISSYKPMLEYECTVTTGDVAQAGTDMKITLTAFGAKGTTAPYVLEKGSDRFERDRVDLIKLEMEDVGPLKKIRVETDGKGSRPDWFLETIELRIMDTGQLYVFKCNSWFSKTKEGGKLVHDIPAMERGKVLLGKTSYKISVKTSDVPGAGTDANVYVILFGANGDSGELHLKTSETNKDPFENNQTDVFMFKNMLSLGELSKCRVWHDNKGWGAAWHLSYIEVEDEQTKKKYTFHCDRWLAKNEDDKQILRELTCGTTAKPSSPGSKDKTTYEMEVITTDKKEAGTIHNGWVILEGPKGEKKFLMENSPRNKILRRGEPNYFSFNSKPLGKLQKVIVGASEREDVSIQNPDSREAMWHCHQITITDTSTGDKYVFPCKDWIPIMEKSFVKRDGKVLKLKAVEESQVSIVRNLANIKYEVNVFTGDVFGAGTNANVHLTIFGSNGDTGRRPLQQDWRDLFERNQRDSFTIESLDLGELLKVRIEHDNKGFRPNWFLDRIEITNLATNEKTTFPCQQWLAKDKGDNLICRDLMPRD